MEVYGMKVKVTKGFPWAEDGNNVRLVAVGEVLEGRGAAIALELKSGEKVGEQASSTAPEPKPDAVPPEASAEKPAEPAPGAKPATKTPRGKAR